MREALIKVSPGSQKDMLLRIQNGFASSLQDIKDAQQMTQETLDKQSFDLKFQLKSITSEFEKYKVSNDLDYLFGKGINIEARSRILQSIKELMVESDWHTIDKEVVEK